MADSRPAKRQRMELETPNLISIVPGGDVILAPQGAASLLVSSTTLSSCSRPFQAMFSKNFLEGQTLNTEAPPTIDLPDDNGVAVQTLCELAHDMTPLADNGITSRDRVVSYIQLLVIADKYDCTQKVKRFLLRKCMRLVWAVSDYGPRRKAFTLEQLIHLVIIAYALGDSRLFRHATSMLMHGTKQKDSFRMANTTIGNHLVPAEYGLWVLLAEEKAAVRNRIFNELKGRLRSPESSKTRVHYSRTRSMMVKETGESWNDLCLEPLVDEWEALGMSTDDILHSLGDDLQMTVSERKVDSCTAIAGLEKLDSGTIVDLRRAIHGSAWVEELYAYVRETRAETGGYCLECLRNNKATTVLPDEIQCDE